MPGRGTLPRVANTPTAANVVSTAPPADVADGSTAMAVVHGGVNFLLISASPLLEMLRRPRRNRSYTAVSPTQMDRTSAENDVCSWRCSSFNNP